MIVVLIRDPKIPLYIPFSRQILFWFQYDDFIFQYSHSEQWTEKFGQYTDHSDTELECYSLDKTLLFELCDANVI